MKLPDFRLPSPIASLGRKLPSPVHTLPLLGMLDIARRRGWLTPPPALEGRQFRLVIDDLGVTARFRCVNGRFKSTPRASAVADDLTLSADAVDYLRLTLGLEDADTLFFRRRLKIEGDTELGLEVKYWLDAAERPAWLARMARHFEEQTT